MEKDVDQNEGDFRNRKCVESSRKEIADEDGDVAEEHVEQRVVLGDFWVVISVFEVAV